MESTGTKDTGANGQVNSSDEDIHLDLACHIFQNKTWIHRRSPSDSDPWYKRMAHAEDSKISKASSNKLGTMQPQCLRTKGRGALSGYSGSSPQQIQPPSISPWPNSVDGLVLLCAGDQANFIFIAAKSISSRPRGKLGRTCVHQSTLRNQRYGRAKTTAGRSYRSVSWRPNFPYIVFLPEPATCTMNAPPLASRILTIEFCLHWNPIYIYRRKPPIKEKTIKKLLAF